MADVSPAVDGVMLRLEFPWIWLLAPPLLLYIWWLSRRSYAQLVPVARWGSTGLRAAILLLLIAALSQPTLLRDTDRTHLVFMIDASRSISGSNLDAALEDVDRLASTALEEQSSARVSVIVFGSAPSLLVRQVDDWKGWSDEQRDQLLYAESLPRLYEQRTELISSGADGQALEKLASRVAAVEEFRDTVAGDHTDLDSALRLALNCGSTHERRTVYLFTDGNFNQGDWREAWNAAEAATTIIQTVRLDLERPAEVAAAEIVLPRRVQVNQGFTGDVRIASSVDTEGELIIFRDGYRVEERSITIPAGESLFRVEGLYFRDKGFHTVEAAVRARGDTEVKNNSVRALVIVPGETRVLYVDSDETQIPYLHSALELEGMQVEARPATGMPQNLSELLSFDAFVLSNVPADRISHRQMQMIRSYVVDFGGGFLMLGGDQSFGLGGYFNTPVEEILPVKMPIEKDILRPSLALMLVIDKSGSMEGVKIQLAKRAAMATADAINPRDLIGVIGFDGQSRVILELTPAGDHATVSGHIAALDAGGGTFLYPALDDAHNRLTASNARRKHIIVLSDGQTQGFGYEEFVQVMAADAISVSTVGIGEGADMRLMEAIAMAGGGRSYFTNDFFSIPQIFTREALRASKSMLVEGLIQPIVIGRDICLEDIDAEELPLLTGYVATTPKPDANLIIVSDTGDPLLAKWRYGLGRTAAFTSETKPRWAADWIEWEDFAKFFSQLVRSIAGEEIGASLAVDTGHALHNPGLDLGIDITDDQGDFLRDVSVTLTAIDEAGRVEMLPVQRQDPGRFTATLPKVTYGADQQFNWVIGSGEGEEFSVPYAFVYSFSPEFRTLGVDETVFDQMAARRQGGLVSVGDSRLVANEGRAEEQRQLWPLLLVLALLLIPFDILCRRLG